MKEFKNLKIELLTKPWSTWNTTAKEYVPKYGEVCISTLTTEESAALGGVKTLLKVGDGHTQYQALDYIGGYAADVKDWAKKDSPDFNDFKGSFISLLDDRVDDKISAATNGLASEVWVENKHYLTQHQDISNLASIDYVDEGLSNKQNRIDSVNKLSYDYISNKPNLNIYSEIVSTGYYIGLEMDDEYKIVAKLYNRDSVLLSTSTAIDLPLETVVVNATYNKELKAIILELRGHGKEPIVVPIGDIVSGLVSDIDLNEALTRYTPTSKLADVALTGDYRDLENLPTKLTDFEDDLDYYSTTAVDAKIKVVDDKLVNYELKSDAFDWKYSSLIDPPTNLSLFIDDLGDAKDADLSTVAKSGKFSDLVEKPSDLGDFTNNAGYLLPVDVASFAVKADVDNLIALESTDRTIAINNAISTEVADRNTAIADAVSTEVSNRNTAISAATSPISSDVELLKTTKQDIISSTNKLDVSLVDGLATVATTGSYNDLIDKPTGFATESYVLNYHDNTKQDTLTTSSGVTLVDNVIGYDPDVLSTVDYVDLSITNLETYFTQELNNEHAGRVAGDNLLWDAVNGKQDKLPDAPTTDGVYILQATVVDGIPTFSWVSKE